MARKGSVESEIMAKIDAAAAREADQKLVERAQDGKVKIDFLNGEGVEFSRPWWTYLRRSWPRPRRRGW